MTDDIFLCAPLGDGREICLSPLSRQTFEQNQLYAFGDDCGYFIYEFDSNQPSAGIQVLAKAASYDAALRLVDIFLGAQAKAPQPLGAD
jgi:hypothetical protein